MDNKQKPGQQQGKKPEMKKEWNPTKPGQQQKGQGFNPQGGQSGGQGGKK